MISTGTSYPGTTLVANPSLGVPLIGHFGGTIEGWKTCDTIIVDTTVSATFHTDASNPALVDMVETANTGVVLVPCCSTHPDRRLP